MNAIKIRLFWPTILNLKHFIILLCLSFSSVLHAEIVVTPWTPIYEGIDQANGTTDASDPRLQKVYALRIDLLNPAISFYSTPHAGTKDTISATATQFVISSGVKVAINANYFVECCNNFVEDKTLRGLAISEGQVVSQPESDGAIGENILKITQDNIANFDTTTVGYDLSGIETAIAGRFYLVQNGLSVANTATEVAPRTLIGLSQDGRYLYLIAIDGRQPGYSDGATNEDSAQWLIRLGAYTGLNLDGGGSTTMARSDDQGGAILIDRPIAGTVSGVERYDGNHLGVMSELYVGPIDSVAQSETAVQGTVSGDYPDTWASDSTTESVTEIVTGQGKRSYSSLEHSWNFEVPVGSSVTAVVEAWGGSSEDQFRFEVSTDNGSSYSPMFVAPLQPGGSQSYALPASTSGTVLIRVVDTDSSKNNVMLDTVYVDHIYIRSQVGGAAQAPAAPTSLSATANAWNEVALSWTDAANNEYGFNVERSPDGNSWTPLASVGQDTVSYLDTTVSGNMTYYYRVAAYNGAGNSGYSNSASVTTPEGPATGQLALSSAVGYKIKGIQTVDLTWTGGVGTQVEIRKDGAVVATVTNNGFYTYDLGVKGAGTYSFAVCEVGTSTCSNALDVVY